MDQSTLSWFGYAERIKDGRLTKGFRAEVSKVKRRDRLKKRWKNRVGKLMEFGSLSFGGVSEVGKG